MIRAHVLPLGSISAILEGRDPRGRVADKAIPVSTGRHLRQAWIGPFDGGNGPPKRLFSIPSVSRDGRGVSAA